MANLGPGHLTLTLFKFVRRRLINKKVSSIRQKSEHVFVTGNRLPTSVREHPPGRNVAFVFSHWNHLVDNFNDSPQAFYHALEDAIVSRQLPRLKLSRVRYFEGGLFSPRREYLRVTQGEYIFDICVSPLGGSFFVSWWLGLRNKSLLRELLSLIPVIGRFLDSVLQPMTYYHMDKAIVFQDSIHTAVLRMVDERTRLQGSRSPTGTERNPIMAERFWNGL